MEANEAERRRWNDEDWVAVWPKREALTDSITPYLLEALDLQPGERVLDVGCGGGKTTIAAARAVGPTGTAIGADISGPLTKLAADRAAEAHVNNVTFRVADMQLEDVPEGPFDVIMSQFGVMFFDEPVPAFTNIHSHLQPDGRLTFACWQTLDRNPWFIASALAGFVPPPLPPAPGKSPTGGFVLGDAERTQGILESAGFVNVRRTVHELLPEVPYDAVVDDTQLIRLGVPPDQMVAAREAVNRHLEQFHSSPGMAKFPLAFQIFQATPR